MTQARVGKWGNHLAVRLPDEVVRSARLREGERVEVEAQADTIIIRRVDPAVALEALFRGRTAEEWRSVYAGAYDWGADIGRAIVEG